MPSNTSPKFWILSIGCILIAIATTQSLRTASLRTELSLKIDTLENEIAATPDLAQKIFSLNAQIDRLEANISQLQIAQAQEAAALETRKSPQSETVKESILDAWLARADRLSRYLEQNESLKIPELKYLSAMDWLDVTKFKTIETAADYRAACAQLRQTAKSHILPKIQDALNAYRKAANGALPKDATDLLPYSQGAFDLEVINRYQINPSGALEFAPQYIKKNYFLQERMPPVDPIWNTRAFLSGEEAQVYFGRPDLLLENAKDAFARFEAEHQRPPSHSQELEPYIAKDNIQILPQLFEAISTPASLTP